MATPPTGSLWDLQSSRIQEVINKSIDVYLPAGDPVTRDLVQSNQGVLPSDNIGRDWKIIKVMLGGYAGVMEQGGPTADFTLYGDQGNTALGPKIHLQGLVNKWPSALESPNPSPYRLGVPMRSMLTNLPVMLSELQAEKMDSFIGQVISHKLDGFGAMQAAQVQNYVYLSQNEFYAIADVGDVSVYGSVESSPGGSNDTLVINLQGSNKAVNRLFWGDRVQFYDSTGATLRTTASGESIFYVVATDELSGKVKFMAKDGSALNAANFYSGLSDNDIIVYANSKGNANTPYSSSTGQYFTGVAGLNSWIKAGDSNGATNNATNTLLGEERDTANAINVNVHPEHRSLVYDLANQPLTEQTLRRILRLWHRAKGRYGMTIDCLIASDGVWLEYERQKIGREWIDRTGRRSSMSAEGSSDEGIMFEFDGRSYKGYTSQWVESGTVYGIKKGGNNWKKMVPPDPRSLAGSVRRFDRQGAEGAFRFVGPAMGHNSIFFPIYTVSGGQTFLTEGLQAPGMLRMQLVPDQAAGLKLTSVAEDRLYV